ncbi:Gfo/Idh/MocA family protein [Actibacterium sp. XHP0104]|uniref:Gfo/Idh/MocA family protein n=1 Tax=Actibacterium sp. XHP0104 TaxID=2984335 RepID=UPI0021E895D5|nr:Gfo/Idh/MocA family oxidoreductase [Actibacterium sp. XHP0104]MCV2881864.1 Gfo/Idh/MocA family oxidoreductase [Actibacterium sp. XHP0104]
MTKTLGLGIVGTGRMAARMMQTLAHVPGVQAVAVASGEQARARDFAARFGIQAALGDVAELAARSDVDAIYVAGRTGAHAAAARAAIEARQPVLVEKPLAAGRDDARALTDEARRRGVLLVENLWCLALPAWREMARVVTSGDLGAPLHMDFAFGYPVTRAGYGSVFDPADGGALRDRGIYGVSLAISLLGSVSDVHTTLRRDEAGADLGADLMLRHAGGATSHIAVALDALMHNSASVSCAGGLLRLEPPVVGAERLLVQPMAPLGAPGQGGGLGDRLRAMPAARKMAQKRNALKPAFHSFGADQYAPMMTHFRDLVIGNRTESDLIPHDLSLAAQDVLHRARAEKD